MFFYVDEGGNTGLNLFDPNQPILYYGVLCSAVDLDKAALSAIVKMRETLNVERLHAKDLGNDKLALIATSIMAIQKDFDLRFDFYRVHKADHAVVSFFDQVFDSANNQAVKYEDYWTPRRYFFLLQLAYLFNEPLAKKAWEARIDANDARSQKTLTEVCEKLLEELTKVEEESGGLADDLRNALTWAAQNPSKISYNVDTDHLPKKEKKGPAHQASPNIIGFQFVMQGIARRLEKAKLPASRIVVDLQSEFNDAQNVLAQYYSAAAGIELMTGPGMPKIDFTSMPNTPIEFISSQGSAGLELVDIFLWIHRRLAECKPVAEELMPIYESNVGQGSGDEMSLQAIWNRWVKPLQKKSS